MIGPANALQDALGFSRVLPGNRYSDNAQTSAVSSNGVSKPGSLRLDRHLPNLRLSLTESRNCIKWAAARPLETIFHAHSGPHTTSPEMQQQRLFLL